MKEKIIMINMIKNHNDILRLKSENTKKQQKIDNLVNDCKNIIKEYQEENGKAIREIESKISSLEDENKRLKKEIVFYKEALNKIPRFILRIFNGNAKELTKGE